MHIRSSFNFEVNEITSKESGVFDVNFTPAKKGNYTIAVSVKGKSIPNSSFTVKCDSVIDLTKATVSGTDKAVEGEQSQIIVKCFDKLGDEKTINPKDITVSIVDAKGSKQGI